MFLNTLIKKILVLYNIYPRGKGYGCPSKESWAQILAWTNWPFVHQ